ncbi:hypothetical protein F5051DRAFT_468340 [Lentinula edodes]|nr:hypothetical protein F5051DRAFT_468340 [Lentinula edodes]
MSWKAQVGKIKIWYVSDLEKLLFFTNLPSSYETYMRCNWFPKASCITLYKALAEYCTALRGLSKYSDLLRINLRQKTSAFVLHRSVSTSIQRSTFSDPFDTSDHLLSGTNTNEHDLTPSQLSRAVWQSVRLALQTQDPHTAYIIVESARLSNQPLLHNASSKRNRASGIEFYRPVSSRLAGHALIHGLLRLGLPRRAQVAAKILMDNGVPLNHKTFEAVLKALVTSDGNIPQLKRAIQFLENSSSEKHYTIPEPNFHWRKG